MTITMARSRAEQLARSTPAGRDRYVDFLRLAALAAVILGHWLMAVVSTGPDGSVHATNLLAVVPALQPLTWLVQVMPVFFLVGGFSHATALDSIERRGGSYADFARSRGGRLLRPTALFVAIWLGLGVVLEATGQDGGLLRLAARTVAQPLWFIGVYLGVVALAPVMLRLHRRLGRWAVTAPAGLALGSCAVDALRFAGDIPHVGYLNVALVWLAVHQVGFCYADGTLQRGGRRLAFGLTGAGLVATVALTSYGPYPVSMVGLPGDRVSNMSPPTLALLTHAVWLTGLVLLLRAPVSRWLDRPRVWAAVVAGSGLAMTAFLWHLTAMFAATAVVSGLGLPQPAPDSTAYWLLRPVWIALLTAVVAALIGAFRAADRARPTRVAAGRRTGESSAAAAGLTLSAVGVLGLSAVGFGGALAGHTATLVVLPVTPLVSAALIVAGAALLSASARPGTG